MIETTNACVLLFICFIIKESMVMIHLFRELQAYLEIGNGKDGGILLINSITYSNRVDDFLNCAILLVIACSSQKGL